MSYLRQVSCPQHGQRSIDLDSPDRDPMCENCRVVDAHGRPLGWKDGRPTEYVDINAMYQTGTPWSNRLVAETQTRSAQAFQGHPERECGEHHTTGGRAWCHGCSEWCYPEMPCKGCEVPQLRNAIERVGVLHRQGVDSSRGVLVHDGECVECERPWPCPTIRTLNQDT